MNKSDKNEKSKLEYLSERIYSRTNPPKSKGRRRFFRRQIEVPQEPDPKLIDLSGNYGKENREKIKQAPLNVFYEEEKEKRSGSFFKIFFVFSLFFFLMSLALSYIFFVSGFGELGEKKVKMLVSAPEFAESGELIQMQIVIENLSSSDLELADLVIDYPLGTIIPEQAYGNAYRREGSKKTKVVRQRSPLGTIKAGELKKGTVRARIFGKDNSKEDIYVTLEYRLKDSNAIFAIKRKHSLKLTSDALSIDVKGPKEVMFGQKPVIDVSLKNNSKSVMNFIILKLETPFGFKVEAAKPEPEKDNLWYFESLKPGEEKKIKLVGSLDGQSGDSRTLKFVAGIKDVLESSNSKIAKAFQDSEYELKVARPFLSAEIVLGKQNGDFTVLRSGSENEGKIKWINTLPHKVKDLLIALSIEGDAINKFAIDAQDGFYKSSDNMIIWDRSTSPQDFDMVGAGEGGELKFTLGVLPKEQILHIKNPEITLTLHASGKRLSESSVQDALKMARTLKARIQSDVEVEAKSLYFDNPLGSAGPLPPKVDKATVYGIELSVKNSVNDLKNAIITAYMPPNVDWKSVSMPASERITFNPTNGKVVWRLGKVKAGTGYDLPARRVFFNVMLVPSASQLGSPATLLHNIKFSAEDSFTESEIEFDVEKVDSKIYEAGEDPRYFKVVR